MKIEDFLRKIKKTEYCREISVSKVNDLSRAIDCGRVVINAEKHKGDAKSEWDLMVR